MIIAKRLKGKAIAAWLGPTGEAARRAIADVRHKLQKEPSKLELYFDISDPWSYVAAQAASRLIDAYPVDFAFYPVTPPASDVNAHPEMRVKHAVRDAQQLADYWDVDFPGKKEADPGAVRDVASALIKERPAKEQLRAAIELAHVMWSNDRKTLAKLLGTWGTESTGAIAPILNANYGELRKSGHYQGAMLHYGGEWYWSIDRLSHLETALAKDFKCDVAHVVTPKPESARKPVPLAEKPTSPLALEMWFSFRSPYSYIALEQIESILAPYDIALQLRPILPMVSRGVPLPNVKRMYIVRDAKREADRASVPFGEICDPLGTGIENCIAISYWASQRSQADLLAFAKSAMRGSWSEARDMAEYVDLRHIVERAGLPWAEAKDAIGNPAAQKWANAAAQDLQVIGLWGVPSFRIGDFITWGQDRLPLLADRLRRNKANG
ncbi:MAG TPA: DsbA family protein [Kofleriaceae bacterium]|nr:DsbA family protein [Kofleriaceae bacterium]